MDVELTLSDMGIKFDPRVIDAWLESEAKGGWREVICQGCGKLGMIYLEPVEYGVVRSNCHGYCPECIERGQKYENYRRRAAM